MDGEFADMVAPIAHGAGGAIRENERTGAGLRLGSNAAGRCRLLAPGLKTTVRILLTSRFPMWMAWGPELTVLYNDAYARTTLGKKHPWALGKPASVVWSEIWKDIGPRIERVLETGEASWDETLFLILERGGYPEETYHTFLVQPPGRAGRRPTTACCASSWKTPAGSSANGNLTSLGSAGRGAGRTPTPGPKSSPRSSAGFAGRGIFLSRCSISSMKTTRTG